MRPCFAAAGVASEGVGLPVFGVPGAGFGEADFGIGAKAQVPAVSVYDDSLNPRSGPVVGDAEVESVTVSVAAGFEEEAFEFGGGQSRHQSHIKTHRMNRIIGD